MSKYPEDKQSRFRVNIDTDRFFDEDNFFRNVQEQNFSS